jgi:ribosome biogenesis GTPase / thiamine phosphate phosphatase
LHESLVRFGWTPERETEFRSYRDNDLVPGRVAVEHRSEYVLYGADGEMRAKLAGKVRHIGEKPVVGDWVAVRKPATIVAVMPRATSFSRKEPWAPPVQQVLAANVDTVFAVTAFGRDLNPRRIERYLTAAWDSGAQPAIVVAKLDLAQDPASDLAAVEAVALGVAVHAVSSVTGAGLEELQPYFQRNQTVALLGSSGVGKSTLVNRLAGRELLATSDVRRDGRGRHTTTHRELVPLPRGGLVLDTPGLRELQLWESGEGLERAFGDIEAIAARCRFNDCAHEREPGCAVREAIASGALPRSRLDSYRKLEREQERLARRLDQRLQAEYGQQIRRQARRRRRTQRVRRR